MTRNTYSQREKASPSRRTFLCAIAASLAVKLAAVAAMAQGSTTPVSKPENTSTYIALVIGNGRFAEPHTLAQPALDAAAIAERLRQRGFRILAAASDGTCSDGEAQIDLTRDAMLSALSCLTKAAAGAEQAVVYFSGHTIGIDGKTYLVPADMALSTRPDAASLVDLTTILSDLEVAKPRLHVVIVDGARTSLAELNSQPAGGKKFPTVTTARIVAISAPARPAARSAPSTGGSKPESGPDPASPPRKGEQEEQPGSSSTATGTKHDELSPVTQRFVKAFDADLDERSLGEPGRDAAQLLQAAASIDKSAESQPSIDLVMENVKTPGLFGRMPALGAEMCDVLRWRATNLKSCIELAASFEHCGEQDAFRGLLMKTCPKDWDSMMRYRLRSSLAGSMKANTCQSFKDLLGRFENEQSVKELSEYKELQSLSQYSCALEAQETLKKEFAGIVSARECKTAEKFMASNSPALDADMRMKVEQLTKEICCQNVSLKGECLSGAAALSKVVTMLEAKGCDTGRDKKGKSRRAEYLMERMRPQSENSFKLDAQRISLDGTWTALEKMPKQDCTCKNREILTSTGACKTGSKP